MIRILIIAAAIFFLTPVKAQDMSWTKLPLKGKHLTIDAKEMSLTVEGYDGSEIMLSPVDGQAINSEIRETENSIQLILPAGSCKEAIVRIPLNTRLRLSCTSILPGNKLLVKDLTDSLSIQGRMDIVELNNLSGVFNASNMRDSQRGEKRGKIIVSNIKWQWRSPDARTLKPAPVNYSISGFYADVYLSMPADLSARVSLMQMRRWAGRDVQGIVFQDPEGAVFLDPALKLITEYIPDQSPNKRTSLKLNTGIGTSIYISSTSGDISLKKQETTN